ADVQLRRLSRHGSHHRGLRAGDEGNCNGVARLPAAAPPVIDRAPPAARPLPWFRSSWSEFAQFAALSGIAIWLTVRGAQSMGYNWQWAKVPRLLYRIVDGELIWGPLMKGLFVTLDIAWIAALLTLAIGLATAVLRLSPSIVGRSI